MPKSCAPKGRISYKQRERLPARAFALPSVKMFPLYKRGPGDTLLPSRNHAINAKGRAQQAYNRGELSKSSLAMIDRQADRVIKECEMAKKKKSTKRSFNPRTGRAMAKGAKRTAQSREFLTSREINMLRSVDRGAKAGSPRKSSNYSSDSAKNLLRSLSRRKLITQISPGKGYMVTSAGARAIGNVYLGKNEIKAKLGKKTAKKTVKKVAKRTAKKVAKRTAKKVAKKTAKKVAKKTAKKVAKRTAKKTAKRRPKRRVVKARYGKGKSRVQVKVDGSKTRVPVEIRDSKAVKNKVLILV